MRKLFKHIACCSLLFSVQFSVCAENEPDVLDDFLQGLDSLQADFKQTLINEQGQVLETSSGVVYMQRPGKFYWDYQKPYAQKIITDGETLWLYDEDLEQVTIRDITNSLDKTPAAVLSGQENIEDHFVAINMGTIEGYEWIELSPRDAENQYNSIRLGFDGEQIGMMILHDNLGQTTRIDFINPRRNENLDKSLFSFKPPEGVDIIDSREQG